MIQARATPKNGNYGSFDFHSSFQSFRKEPYSMVKAKTHSASGSINIKNKEMINLEKYMCKKMKSLMMLNYKGICVRHYCKVGFG